MLKSKVYSATVTRIDLDYPKLIRLKGNKCG